MRYHRENTDIEIATCKIDHPLCNRYTLYYKEDKGFGVVQLRYNSKMKVAWWDCIDESIKYLMLENDGFDEYFEKMATIKNEFGYYPIVNLRKIMWALRMKPIPKTEWEKGFES